MRHSGEAKRLAIRPQFHKLASKVDQGNEELQHESQQSSVFHNLSAVLKQPSSRFSCAELNDAYKDLALMVAATEDIGDLIEDDKTVLVFKEKIIRTSYVDVVKTRFIVYQKGGTEGVIKIKDGNHTNKFDDDEEKQSPFTFRQCTFFFCDTSTKDGHLTKSYFEGIQVDCSSPICFEDCAFIGISYCKIGTKTQGVPFKAFTDFSSMVNLEFENPISADEARDILREAPGVSVIDKREPGGYATPVEAAGEYDTYVSRIREDVTIENGLSLWVVSDNLRKGAALNTVQILETLIERNLVTQRAA